jgi:hypothetical protein
MSDELALSEAERSAGIVRCDACPVLCRIRPGRAGACDRYANEDGRLVRVDPLVLLAKPDLARVAFVEGSESWAGELGKGEGAFVTGIGATTTYPDYKPAPFIVSSKHDGVDMVTVVTEGIFSYCGVKVKIDTDRYLGPEQAAVRVKGEAVGHVTTASTARRCCRWAACITSRAAARRRASSPATRCWRFATRRRWNSRSTAVHRSSCKPTNRRW